MKRIRLFLICFLIFFLGVQTAASGQSTPARLKARERERAPAAASGVELYRPVELVTDEGSLFILDMDDHNVKVFSKDGVFKYAFGRKGQGPGEFSRPCGLDVLNGRVYVDDAGNRSIQEKLLHGYDGRGELLWEAVDSTFSGDSVHDLLRNRMFIRKSGGGEIWLVPSADSRIVRRISAAGVMLGELKVGEGYPLKEVAIAASRSRRSTLRLFCWNCALDGETLYLLVPERTADADLGPGRTLAAVGRSGEPAALIDLPARVSRIAVDGPAIFAVDPEGRLRLFEVGPR